MDMNDQRRIKAPRETVWTALNDPDVLKQCIPGCESIIKLSDTEMEAVSTLKIGPIKASFKGRVTLSEIDPPNGYRITGEGSGGTAGHAKGGAKVTLEPDGEATILHYEVKAEVGGKLAQLGSRLIDVTSKKLAGDFFEKFGKSVVAEFVPDTAPVSLPVRENQVRSAPKSQKGWFGGFLTKLGAATIKVGEFFERTGKSIGGESVPATEQDDSAESKPGAKKGWLCSLFTKSSAALILAVGLGVPTCCLDGSHHKADGFLYSICAAAR